MLQEANALAKRLGKIKNSVLQGGGSKAGYLGELALARYLGASRVSTDEGAGKFSHDILWRGYRIEVKTTRRTVPPRPDYVASIAHTSDHQDPDLYAFVSLCFETAEKSHPKVYKGLKGIYFVGFAIPDLFKLCAEEIKKGEQDGHNDFVAHWTKYNLEIKYLMTLKEGWRNGI